MNAQVIIIAIFFVAAVYYIGRKMYNSLFAKKGCGTDCKCGVDFSNIEAPKQKQ